MTLATRIRRIVVPVGLLAVVAWGAGLAWFISRIREPVLPPPAHTDGIVALTGGAGRVELALRLLAEGRARWLLVSGIGGGTDLATLSRLAGIPTAALAGRITLGRYAASTRGNGLETAAWAEQNRVHSLIVVTAAWHMPRALVELHAALPDVRLYPAPVGTGQIPIWLEVQEYTKYLIVASGLDTWFPSRESRGAQAGDGV